MIAPQATTVQYNLLALQMLLINSLVHMELTVIKLIFSCLLIAHHVLLENTVI